MATFSQTLSGDSRYSITLTVTENVPSDYISTNKTNVTYNLTATKSSGSGYWDYNTQNPVRVIINGSTVVDKVISYDFTGSTPKTITLASGTVNGISHNADGSKTIDVSGYFRDIDNGLGSATASGSLTLTKIPRQANLSTAQDFNDESNPTITYTNSAGNAVTSLQARIENTSGSTAYAGYRDVNKTGTLSYTFNLTTAERNALRNATPNSNTMAVRFNLKTVIGGNTYYSTMNKTMTIVNGNPTFNNFTFEDTDSTTLALTGNNQYCILGYSNIKAIISTANKAIANKGASMSKYQFVCGNTTKDISYSSYSDANGTIDNVSSGTYTVYAIDSRGNSKSISKTASNIINYSKVYLNANNSYLERDNSGVGGNVTLHYEGTLWNNSFGSITNGIQAIVYSFKKTTETNYKTGETDITPVIEGNNISFTGLIKSDNEDYTFDLDSSYNVRIYIRDELSSYAIDLILNSGKPNLSYADDGMGIMGDYNEDLGGNLQIGGYRSFEFRKLITDVLETDNHHKIGFGYYNTNTSNIPTGVNNYGTVIFLPLADSYEGYQVILIGNSNGTNAIREHKIAINSYVNNSWMGWRYIDNYSIYSQSETLIGVWIDGKPLYRKVVTSSMSSSETQKTISLGISNVDTYVNVDVRILRSSSFTNNSNVGGYYWSGTDAFNWYLSTPSSGQLTIRGGESWPVRPYNFAVIVEYTKTTD